VTDLRQLARMDVIKDFQDEIRAMDRDLAFMAKKADKYHDALIEILDGDDIWECRAIARKALGHD